MSVPGFPSIPSRVSEYLCDLFWQRGRALLLSFDAGWRLRDIRGDAVYYGVDGSNPEKSVQMLRDLFIGLPLDEPQGLPFVELPNGTSAHLHLIPDRDAYHVLLMDAAAERDRQRATQQLGNEQALASQPNRRRSGSSSRSAPSSSASTPSSRRRMR